MLASSGAARFAGTMAAFRPPARLMATAKMLKYPSRGESVTMLEESSSLSSPSGSQALVKFLAAPVTRTDFLPIQSSEMRELAVKEVGVRFAKAQSVTPPSALSGILDKLPSTPAVGGLTGVAVVEQVGSSVKGIKEGDWVVPAAGVGSWCSHAVVDESDLVTVPSDIPVEYAAVLGSAPCAAMKLLEMGGLKDGDMFVLNGAEGLVGQTLIQLAAAKGIKTVALLKGRPGLEDISPHLKTLGATVVYPDHITKDYQMKELMKTLPPAKIGYDGVGGASGAAVAGLLPTGGTLVSYGCDDSHSGKEFLIPSEKKISVKQFSLASVPMSQRAATISELASMVKSEKLKLLLERASFDQYRLALRKAYEGPRDRTLVMKMA